MIMSEAYRDLGGNLPYFDYEVQLANHQAVLDSEHFALEDAILVERFDQLGIGLQKPEWFTDPWVDDVISKGKFTEAARVQFTREYCDVFGKIRAAWMEAQHGDDQLRATALSGAMHMFRMPGEYVSSPLDNPQLVTAAKSALFLHKPRNVREDTYLAKQAQQARELGLPGNVGCRLSENGLPELYVITQLDRQQRVTRAALDAARQAIRGVQSRESA